jgi:mono/diheme cytochrome c family protein
VEDAQQLFLMVTTPIIKPVIVTFFVVLLNLAHIDVFGAESRGYDPALLEQGKAIFKANCSTCHGDNAQGSGTNWHQRDANGKFPPPPLNGTAHTWHHPINGLAHTIKKVTLEIGGSMLAWEGKLSHEEVFSVILWLSSLWPDEIYNAWIQRSTN